MRRRRTRLIEAESVLAASSSLATMHALWSERGYVMSQGRLWLNQNGTWTARIVWRNRSEIVSTVTCVARGIVLS